MQGNWFPVTVLLALACVHAAAAPVLRVLAWPGYAEPEVVRDFEAKTGAHVELTVIDTDESMWQRLNANGGADFDVFAVNTAELQRYIHAQLVRPVDPTLIPNTRAQLPRFHQRASIPGLVHTQGGVAQTLSLIHI